MSYEDFCKYWTEIQGCRIFYKSEYLKQMFKGRFDTGTNGGQYSTSSCPKYYFEITGDEKVKVGISLMQTDKRRIVNKKTRNLYNGIKLYKVQNKDGKLGNSIKLARSWNRETSIIEELAPGKYVVCPFIQEKKKTNFWIRVYLPQAFTLEQIYPKPEGSTYEKYVKMNDEAREEFFSKG